MAGINAQEALEGAGLTAIEAKVYMELLDIGSSTAGPVVKSLGLHRATVYAVLQRLIGRGLVSYVTREGRRYFAAKDPEGILDMVKEKEEGLRAVLPQLKAKAELAKEGQAAGVYEGNKGIRAVLESMLRKGLEPGEEYLVLGALEDVPLGPYLNRWLKRWSDAGNPVKMLFAQGADKSRSSGIMALPRAEVKYMPSSYASPATVGILNDQTNVFLWTARKPLCISIDSREVADSFKRYFRLIWNQDVKVYKGFGDVFGLLHSNLEALGPGEEYQVLGANFGQSGTRLHEMFTEYHRKRISKGVKASLLYNLPAGEGIRSIFRAAGDPKFIHSKLKAMPGSFDSPVQIMLYGKLSKSVIAIWQKEPLAIEIDNKAIYENFRRYFDALWNQEVRIEKGLDAVEHLFDEALEAGEVDAIGARGYLFDVRPKFTDDWEKRAAAKGFRMRNIVDIEAKGHHITTLPFVETRYNIPKEFSNLVVFWIYGNKVAIVNWMEKEPIVLVIENKNLHDAYREQFRLLWNQGSMTYRGVENIKRVFTETSYSLKEGDTWYAFVITKTAGEIHDFFVDLQLKRAKLGIKTKMIFSEDSADKYRIRRNMPLTSARLIDSRFSSPALVNVCGDVVLINFWTVEGEPIVHKIMDKKIAEMYKKHFDALWEIAKK